MDRPLRILVVCTANICRSPAAALALRHEFASRPELAVAVDSAGTAASDGAAACDLSSALISTYPIRHDPATPERIDSSAHRSRRVEVADLKSHELIITMDRSHRSALAGLDLASRSRTFTLRQATTIASGIAEGIQQGELPAGAPPLPATPQERLQWFVAELDAGRGQYHQIPATQTPQEESHWHFADVPDPHVVGYQAHQPAIELITTNVAALVAALDAVVAAPDSLAASDTT